jgi:hypothetical protein
MQLRIRSWAAAFVVALALPAVPAAAEDKPAPAPAVPAEELALKITGLEAQVQQHVEEKSADAMRQDLVEVQKLLPTVTDAKLRARVTALVPKILGAAKDDVLIKAALKALGETGDASLYRHLKPFLAQPNPKDLPPFLLDAIDVASKLKADDSVNVLLALVEKSKRLEVAVAAMKALGHFGQSKRMREKIVAELVSTTRRDVPGIGYDPYGGDPSQRQKRVRSGDESMSRWDALSGALTPALNQLTGQNCASAHDWFDLHDRYKTNLGALFPPK